MLYAREFGWTDEQVDNLPMTLEPWYLPISYAITKAENARQAAAEAAAKPAKGGRHRR